MGLFSVVGGFLGGSAVKKGLNKAASAQQASSTDQIGRLDDALSATTAGYAPYASLGSSAAGAYADLMGLGGQASQAFNAQQYLAANPDIAAGYQATADKEQFPTLESYAQWHYNNYGMGEGRAPNSDVGIGAETAQANAIAGLEKSPLFTSLIRNGEEGILANASATGGLRGGNTIDRLTNFRADTLASTIQNQLAGYQGAIGTGMGAQGALTAAQYGTANGSNQAQQMATDAMIQKILGKAGVNSQNWSNVGGFLDKAASGGGVGKALKTVGNLF